MNYLAHLYLSGTNEDILLGNFIGDSVKGNKYKNFPDDMQKGILLHRNIDTFTDSHPLHRKSNNRFKPHYHKHSGIITDILYDHLLSVNWDKYSEVPLDKFIRSTYILAIYRFGILPARAKRFLPFMVARNWLGMYSSIDGIGLIFQRMAKNTSLPAESKFAVKIIKENYESFNEEFLDFFDEVIDFVNDNYQLDIKKRGV